MEEGMRKSGVDIIGDVPWSAHFCQFYQTKEDLVDILVPYFNEGLENNEFCIWVTSEPLGEKEAKKAMRGALAKGFDGMRITGNAFWLEKRDWKDFTHYEEKVNSVIGEYRMLAICTYSLERCGPFELIDVVKNHQFALIRREGKWELMESSERKRREVRIESLSRFPSENPSPVLRVAPDGKVLYTNDAGKEIFKVEVGSKMARKYVPFLKEAVSSQKYVSFEERIGER